MTFAPPISHVVFEHVEEAAFLRHVRSRLVRAPDVRLAELHRHDQRIAAHLDGVGVAGDFGWQACLESGPDKSAGAMFTATVRALEDERGDALDQLIAQAKAASALRSGMLSAFGWVSAASLRDLVARMLAASDPFVRAAGLVVCGMHRVDAACAIAQALQDGDAFLRHTGLRVAGYLGCIDALPACLAALADADHECRFHAASAALMLGERTRSLATLEEFASQPGPWRMCALNLLLKTTSLAQAHELLSALAQEPEGQRAAVQAVGIAGDPRYVPWLLAKIDDPANARSAGRSIGAIVGLDCDAPDFEGLALAVSDPVSDSEPLDMALGLEEDEGLPWPDPAKARAWWAANGHRFAAGVRYFVGAPPARAHCLNVLRHANQQYRRAAAQHLCILEPGFKLFNTAAPAWRQQRWLDAMQA